MTKSQVLKLVDAYSKYITQEYERYNQEQLIRLDNEIHSRKWWQFWIVKFTSAQEAKEYLFNNIMLVDKVVTAWCWKEETYNDEMRHANRLKTFIACSVSDTVTVNMKSVGYMIELVGCCGDD